MAERNSPSGFSAARHWAMAPASNGKGRAGPLSGRGAGNGLANRFAQSPTHARDPRRPDETRRSKMGFRATRAWNVVHPVQAQARDDDVNRPGREGQVLLVTLDEM